MFQQLNVRKQQMYRLVFFLGRRQCLNANNWCESDVRESTSNRLFAFRDTINLENVGQAARGTVKSAYIRCLNRHQTAIAIPYQFPNARPWQFSRDGIFFLFFFFIVFLFLFIKYAHSYITYFYWLIFFLLLLFKQMPWQKHG